MLKGIPFKIIILIVIFITRNALQLSAQNNLFKDVSIASPTAASLGKFGDIPVNNHTGIPNISIPIYTIKSGPLELPISLNYHAGGLKVNEPASWVGAGWALVAGGVISRSVNGLPDEKQFNVIYQEKGHYSDYGFNSYYMRPEPSYPNGVFRLDEDFATGKRDGEPDLFSFNVGGYSGKFYFRDDRTPVLVPEQDIKVIVKYVPSGLRFESFTIITPNGTKYYFGKSDRSSIDPVEKTNPTSVANGYEYGSALSSWYLNRIESDDEEFHIDLSYVKEDYCYFTLSTYPVLSYLTDPGHRVIKNNVEGVRLESIAFAIGTVTFVASGVPREDLSGNNSLSFTPETTNSFSKALEEIVISGVDVSECKKFIFRYSYFMDSAAMTAEGFANLNLTADKKRLRLDKVQEISCDYQESIPPYAFNYFDEPVPRRLSLGQDHWGFINGVTTNTRFIPTYTVNNSTEVAGANRNSNWPALRGGSLKNITYPTGGNTEFEFEPNGTWISGLTWTDNERANYQHGFSNNQEPPLQFNYSFSGNSYRFVLSNRPLGGIASITINNLSGAQIFSLSADPDSVVEQTVIIPVGSYSVTLVKNDLPQTSGNGCTVTFFEKTSTPYSRNEMVGGLRIKKITQYDGIDSANSMVSNYSYDSSGISTGILYSRPAYVHIIRNDNLMISGVARFSPTDPPYCSSGGCTTCTDDWSSSSGTIPGGPPEYFKSGAAIRPMETTQGNHIGYKSVTVSNTGIGSTVYKYLGSDKFDTVHSPVAVLDITIQAKLCDIKATSYPFAPLQHEFRRGELKSISIRDNAGLLLKEVNYDYAYQENPIEIPALKVTNYPWELITYYNIRTSKKTRETIIEKRYESGNVMENKSETFFESAFHTQPTRVVQYNSLGDTLVAYTKYVSDFRVPACEAVINCFNSYQSSLAAIEIEFASSYFPCNSNAYCKYWAWDLRIKKLNQNRINFINCQRVNYADPVNEFKTRHDNAKSLANIDLKPILDMQDSGKNVPIETASAISGKLTTASFSLYRYSITEPNAIYPYQLLNINLSSPTNQFDLSTVSGNSILKDNKYEMESTIKYVNGNLVELIPKSGVPVSFIWGYNNSLPIVKVTGKDYTSLSTAYSNAVGNLSLLRNQTILNGGLIQTYEYLPIYGLISETDPKKVSIFYEYDKFGRLNIVRDMQGKILKKFEYSYQLGN